MFFMSAMLLFICSRYSLTRGNCHTFSPVSRAARDTGEKVWQLPLVKEYREQIKSSIADMKNIGGAHGGAITAALILQEFVNDIPWAHLDIAGPAFAESDSALCPKGGTGFGVRTVLRFLSKL